MKPYEAGEPYTVTRIRSVEVKLERLADRVRIEDMVSADPGALITFQDDLVRLQAVIQRDISALKRTVRQKKNLTPALTRLRQLRWYARCLGDALAWQILMEDRKAISALMEGVRPPVVAVTPSSQAAISMAAYLMQQQYGLPIVHDITNWLRVGDLSLALPPINGEAKRIQTVELKSSVVESEELGEGTVHANMIVNMYSNERLHKLEGESYVAEHVTMPNSDIGSDAEEFSTRGQRSDRRLARQFKRLDKMIAHRDMTENALTVVDGVRNIAFRLKHEDSHHWRELRSAIRAARQNGFAFFSIDNFLGYGIFYCFDGFSEDQFKKFAPACSEAVESTLLEPGRANEFLLIREIPMREEYDLEGSPVMRFFSYEIPKVAIREILRGQLTIVGMASLGRLDKALADTGVLVRGINVESIKEGYRYAVDLAWSTGESVRLAIPASQVSSDVERMMYEFASLSDAVQKISSPKLIPGLISYEDFVPSPRADQAPA